MDEDMKHVQAKTKAGFLAALQEGIVTEIDEVFIEDTSEIWYRGKYYPCPYTKEELDAKFTENIPTIGENGNWFINGIDSGKPSRGEKGDTGAKGDKGETGPQGPQGNSGVSGDTSNIEVVNDLTGGESSETAIKVLAAEQGKVLDEKITDTNTKLTELENKTRFPYDDKYAPTQSAIDKGAATMLIDGYLDIEYDDTLSYSIALYQKESSKFLLYSKLKDVAAISENLTRIGDFIAEPIENSKYHILKPEANSVEVLGESWFIVLLPNDSYGNMYDYDGCGISPKIFKGGVNSNIVLNKKIDELNSGLNSNSAITYKNSEKIRQFEANFEVKDTEFKNWSRPLIEGVSTSIFSGWGMILGTDINIKSVKIKVGNRGENPMQNVLFKFYKDRYKGELLAQKNVSVNIEKGGVQDVECVLDNPVYYNENVYMVYFCDQLCTAYTPTSSEAEAFYSKYTPADDVTFPKIVYISNGETEDRYLYPATYNPRYVFGISIISETSALNKEVTDSIKNDIKSEILPEIDSKINAGLEVNLPDKIYATVNDTLQLFYRGMIKAVNPYIYDILIGCSKGKQTPRYFEYTPKVSDVGETDFTLQVRNIEGTILAENTCRLVTVTEAVSPSSNVNIACFGDSLTSAGTWCKELDRRLTESGGSPAGLSLNNIKFVGKLKNGTTGYFGVGGWTWDSYITGGRPAYRFQVSGVSSLNYGDEYTNNGNTFTVIEVNVTEGSGNILCSVSNLLPAPQTSGVLTKTKGSGDESITYSSVAEDSSNPLWDYPENKMTFKPYVTKYCDGKLDCVVTLLSWNGQSPHKKDFTDILNKVKVFADTLHTEYPQCKLKICGIQVPSINGGMGANYGATGTGYSDTFGMVDTALNMNKAYQEFANRDEYKDFVEFINISSQFDSEYNMPSNEVNVNLRNTKKEVIGTNGVHPDIPGYYQIADVIFRNIVANFC